MGKKKSGLGKGLEALFLDDSLETNAPLTLSMEAITPNEEQPRKHFDQEALISLADSIRLHGMIQPMIVRPKLGKDGVYEIIAGERRFRAAKMAGLREVPAIIREIDEKSAMEIALIENLQREDLNPVEEAQGYQELMKRYGLTQEETASRVGKSRSAVANALRLLSLPSFILSQIKEGLISAGQAKALLGFASEERMLKAAEMAVEKHLSVREIERLAQEEKQSAKKDHKAQKENHGFFHDFYQEFALQLTQELQRKVKIIKSGKEKGSLQIDFFSKDDLIDIAYRIANKDKDA